MKIILYLYTTRAVRREPDKSILRFHSTEWSRNSTRTHTEHLPANKLLSVWVKNFYFVCTRFFSESRIIRCVGTRPKLRAIGFEFHISLCAAFFFCLFMLPFAISWRNTHTHNILRCESDEEDWCGSNNLPTFTGRYARSHVTRTGDGLATQIAMLRFPTISIFTQIRKIPTYEISLHRQAYIVYETLISSFANRCFHFSPLFSIIILCCFLVVMSEACDILTQILYFHFICCCPSTRLFDVRNINIYLKSIRRK